MIRPAAAAILASFLIAGSSQAANFRNPLPSPDHDRPSTERPVQLEVGEPYVPPVDSGPKPEQKLPPKLECTFTVVGNVVTIAWTNIGGSEVPAGTFIAGTTSGGIGMTVALQDAIAPGETFEVSHAWEPFDPAWFAEACQAKIKA